MTQHASKSTPHSRPDSVRRFLLHCATVLALTAGLLPCAQARAEGAVPADLGFSFLQERTKFVGSGTNPYFMMRGAKVDFGYEFARGVGLAISGTGLSTVNLRGTLDVEQISLMAGPRYTWNWGHITPTAVHRKGSLFVEGKVGYTIAIAGQYPDHGVVLDHASALTYLGGGGINVHLYERFDLRPLEVEYVRNQLPNGGTNRQNSLRFGTGINFHFGL